MGSALLERLGLAGVAPTVYDCDPVALQRAVALGAAAAQSSAAVGEQSTIVDVVVRSDDEVLECTLGPEGVLEGARPSTLVLLHSTILPQTTRKVAETAGRRGVHVIDACMVGVPAVVRQGNLSFVVGGPADQVERATPHLLRMARQALHVGPLGAGNAAKLIKNLVSGAEALIIQEALRIGEAAGIPHRVALEMLRQVFTGTVLNRWQEVWVDGTVPLPGKNIYDKDLPLAADLARQYGMDLPITERLVEAGRRLLASAT